MTLNEQTAVIILRRFEREALSYSRLYRVLTPTCRDKMLLFGTVTNSWEFTSWWSLARKICYTKGTEVGRFLRYKIIMASLKVAVRARPLNNRWNVMIRYFTNLFVSGICFDVTQCACKTMNFFAFFVHTGNWSSDRNVLFKWKDRKQQYSTRR